jgi:hypothetical protein
MRGKFNTTYWDPIYKDNIVSSIFSEIKILDN